MAEGEEEFGAYGGKKKSRFVQEFKALFFGKKIKMDKWLRGGEAVI